EWKRVFALLLKDGDSKVHSLARRLAVNFQDREAVRRALTIAADASKAVSDRLDALRDLALAHPPEARMVLQGLLASDKDVSVRRAACRALAAYDTPEVARAVLAGYASYPAEVRAEAVNLLAGRK